MSGRRSIFKVSTALGVIIAGGLGLSAFGVPPSAGDQLGWLLHAGELQRVAHIGTVPNRVISTEASENGASLADVVAQVKPAVVSVTSIYTETVRAAAFPRAGHSHVLGEQREGADAPTSRRLVTSHGAGFFISADGYAVTNHHVVESSQTVELTTDDGTSYRARVIAVDQTSDLALLKADGRNDFPFVAFAPKPPRVGEQVFAVGNPYGLGGTVTAGIVSALDRNIGANSYDDLIQIDAPINKGNSGGPCFDLAGHVVGVNTIIFSPSGGSVGIGFAVPADTVSRVTAQLKSGHAVARGWLGLQLQPVTPGIAEALGLKEARGAIIAQTQADGPGAQAGIQSGDVIASFNGERIKDNFDVLRKLDALAPGSIVEIGLVRDGREIMRAVTLGELPVPPAQRGAVADATEQQAPTRRAADLGMMLAPADQAPGNERNGVMVLGIDPAGRAAGLGIDPGDVILDVSGRPVRTPNELREALRSASAAGRPATLMRLKSGDKLRFVAVPLDPA
jgi:serine protease Do